MTATILDGRKIRDEAIPELQKRVAGLYIAPTLSIIQVGDRADTGAYIKAKKAFAEKIGVKVNHIQVPENIKQAELIDLVKKQNEDASISGIIVQVPLPIEIESDDVIGAILPSKDVDGLTPHNIRLWLDGNENMILPATARGVRTLLKYYKIDLFGKKVVVIGRSTLVGKPIIAMCLNENATVTVCHSKTADLTKETQSADIIIVAAGRAGLIKKEHVREGQIIIDVGINSVEGEKLDDEIPERKIVGDVDFDTVSPIVSAITPVPGGVGPLTVLSLFENLLDLMCHSRPLRG